MIPILCLCENDITTWSRHRCNEMKFDIEDCWRMLDHSHNISEDEVQMVVLHKKMT